MLAGTCASMVLEGACALGTDLLNTVACYGAFHGASCSLYSLLPLLLSSTRKDPLCVCYISLLVRTGCWLESLTLHQHSLAGVLLSIPAMSDHLGYEPYEPYEPPEQASTPMRASYSGDRGLPPPRAPQRERPQRNHDK